MINSIHNFLIYLPSVDIITACHDENTNESIEFYRYDYTSGDFIKHDLAKTKTYTSDFKIRNLIANDINGDNLIDLIITVEDLKKQKDSVFTEILLLDLNTREFKRAYQIENSGIFVGDFNGDKM